MKLTEREYYVVKVTCTFTENEEIKGSKGSLNLCPWGNRGLCDKLLPLFNGKTPVDAVKHNTGKISKDDQQVNPPSLSVHLEKAILTSLTGHLQPNHRHGTGRE